MRPLRVRVRHPRGFLENVAHQLGKASKQTPQTQEPGHVRQAELLGRSLGTCSFPSSVLPRGRGASRARWAHFWMCRCASWQGERAAAATSHETRLAPRAAASVPGKREAIQPPPLKWQIRLPLPDSLQPGWLNRSIGSWLPPRASTLTSLGRGRHSSLAPQC